MVATRDRRRRQRDRGGKAGRGARRGACAPHDERGKAPKGPEVEGRAALPADTFALGPPSGSELGDDEINGRKLPFVDQPAQGFSGVIDAGGTDTYWATTDSGYG